MADRGDLLSYELSIGFNLQTEQAMAGLRAVSTEFGYLEKQSAELGRKIQQSLTPESTDNFQKISKQLATAKDLTARISPDLDNQLATHELMSDQLMMQEKLHTQINDRVNDQSTATGDISQKLKRFQEMLAELGTGVTDTFGKIDTKSAGTNIVTQLSKGMMGAIPIANDAVNALVTRIDGYFPHSPALWGPLRGIMSVGGSIVSIIAQGIAGATGLLVGAITKTLTAMMNAAWATIKWLGNKALEFTTTAWGMMIEVGEQFHLLTYRTYGSMYQLTGRVFATAVAYGVLSRHVADAYEQLMRSRIEMTGLGGQANLTTGEFDQLAGTLARMHRMTGMNFQAMANYARQMQRAGDGIASMDRRLTYLAQTMRQFKLTTEEMNNAISVAPDTEWSFLATFGKEAPRQLAELRVGVQALSAAMQLPPGAVEGWTSFFTSSMDIRNATRRFGSVATSMDDMISKTMTFIPQLKDAIGPDGLISDVEARRIQAQWGMNKEQAQQLVAVYDALGPAAASQIKSVEDLNKAIRAMNANKPIEEMYDSSKGIGHNMLLLWDNIAAKFGELLSKMAPIINKVIVWAHRVIIPAIDKMMTHIDAFTQPFLDLANSAGTAKEFLDGLRQLFLSFGLDLGRWSWIDQGYAAITTFFTGIEQGFGWFMGKFDWLMSKIAAFLPNSDAKTGPLSHLTWNGMQLMHTLGEGILKGAGFFMKTLLKSLMPGDFGQILTSLFQSPLKLLGSLLTDGLGLNVLKPIFGIFDQISSFGGLFASTAKKDIVNPILSMFEQTAGKFFDLGFGWIDTFMAGIGGVPIIKHIKEMMSGVLGVLGGPLSMAPIMSMISPVLNGGSLLSGLGIPSILTDLLKGLTADDDEKAMPIVTVQTKPQQDKVRAKDDASLHDVVAGLNKIQSVLETDVREKKHQRDVNADSRPGTYNTAPLTRW